MQKSVSKMSCLTRISAHFSARFISPLLILFVLFFSCQSLSAQIIPKKTRILLMLDCSGSMNGFIGGSKIEKMEVAKKLIIKMVDSLKHIPDVQLALHAYGNRAPRGRQDCKDSHLEVSFDEDNYEQIKKAVKRLEPNGTTPIAYSLTLAQNDFPGMGRGNNYIILITDGFEECGGDPCAVSQTLQSKGITLKPFIIGIGLSVDVIESFHCVGRVYNAKTENDFSEILNLVVSQALNNTTVQVNLNNEHGKPTETDVNMTFYNSKTHEIMNNYYHTLNAKGNPDTFKMDAVFRYDLQVNTTPNIIKKGIELKSGKHNIISLDAAQGNMQILSKTSDGYNVIRCLIREENTTEVVYVQEANSTHRYLTGKYDIEALTLPRTYIKGVKISEGQTIKTEIPQAGNLDISYSKEVVGSIFVLREGGEMEWVIDLAGAGVRGRENFRLQPGNYKVVYRLKSSLQTENSIDKEFKITSANKTGLSLN